jgi:MFS family permease
VACYVRSPSTNLFMGEDLQVARQAYGDERFKSALQALRYRNFRLIWIGQFARGTAQWIQLTAAPLLVLELGGSAIDLGVVAALQSAPVLILAPIAGAAADSVDKRRALSLLQLVMMAQGLLLVVLTAGGLIAIWQVLLLSALFGLANAAEMPIRQAFIAELVPRASLSNAIVLQQAAFSTTRTVAPFIAGVSIIVLGYTLTFAVAALCSLICVVLLSMMDRAQIHALRRRPFGQLGTALSEGGRYVLTSGIVRNTLVVVCGTTAFGLSIQAVMPVFALDVVGLDSWGYGAMLAALGAGTVVGAVLMTSVTAERARMVMTLGLGGLAASLGALSVTQSEYAVFGLVLAVGFTSMTVFSSSNVIVQSAIEHDVRGRVMGLYIAIYSGGAAAGALLAGVVAEQQGVQASIGLMAIGMLMVALWALLRITLPALRAQNSTTTSVEGSTVNRS